LGQYFIRGPSRQTSYPRSDWTTRIETKRVCVELAASLGPVLPLCPPKPIPNQPRKKFRWVVAPWAEFVTRALWHTTARPKAPATRLTQQYRREAKGSSPLPPDVLTSRRENICRGRGKTIRRGRAHCADCAIGEATERLASAARLGRTIARSAEARAKQSATRRRHAQACSVWDAASQPRWFTEQVYAEKIQPLLVRISASTIAKKIGVSRWYAGRIREGYRPHPRHWLALGRLLGMLPDL
jgi:hypothetical protein